MVDMFNRARPGGGLTTLLLDGPGMVDISRRGRAKGVLVAFSLVTVDMLDIFNREGPEGVAGTFLLDELDELPGLPLITASIHRSTLCEAGSMVGMAGSGAGAIASIVRSGTSLKISPAVSVV